jgi:hypothetical protein
MATLRADENRYLLLATPQERAKVARIPGARPLPGQRGWQLPRQAAVILALDRVLGSRGWAVDPDLGHEVAEARARRYPPAEDEARVHLEGGNLAVECTIADKELVKQVPGYRWSPAQRRWYLAAMPLALDVLREAFGDRLSVDRDAEEFLNLRRIDEEREVERATARAEPPPVVTPPPDAPASAVGQQETPPLNESAAYRDLRQLPAGDGLGAVLERLIDAVEGLTARLDSLSPGFATVAAAPAALPLVPEAEDDADAGDWREILARSASDPADALAAARRRLETTAEPGLELRAVAGIAAARAGATEEAFRSLKKALEGPGRLEDGDLAGRAASTYVEVVLALIGADCGPVEPVTTVDVLRELLRRELSNDGGFDDAIFAGAGARGTLDALVNDRALRVVSPGLSDYCRVLYLLSTARGGTRMASERVADLLNDPTVSADAFALGCVLLACVLQDVPCVDEWMLRWPGLEDDAPLRDGGWLVELAVRRLGTASPTVTGEAALAVLACIAAGPAEQATVAQRRELVAYIPTGHHGRRYAEFLALYRPAAAGGRLPFDSFPGYVEVLATVPLVKSATYLTEVYLNGEGQSGSAVQMLADRVYPLALEKAGITDAAEQLFPLLDLLAAGSKPDQLLNAIGRLVEDEAFEGAKSLDREGRIRVYRKAFDQSVKQGHDKDSREAFFRLVRALESEPDVQPLIELCHEGLQSIKPAKLPAALTLLEVLLAEGMPFEETLDEALKLMPHKGGDGFADAALHGLQLAYPALREAIAARYPEAADSGNVTEERRFEGQKVVVVGGHQRMKAHGVPVLEHAGLKVSWLDSTEAKTGSQVIDLVRGACELVVINTAYIGHAQSGRAKEAAEKAGKPVVSQPHNGLGSLLEAVRAELQPAEGKAVKRSKVSELRKISRR